jgi:hypothetical protein
MDIHLNGSAEAITLDFLLIQASGIRGRERNLEFPPYIPETQK